MLQIRWTLDGNEQEIIFVGLKIDIIELLIEQNFDLVLNYKASPRTFNARKTIRKVEKNERESEPAK